MAQNRPEEARAALERVQQKAFTASGQASTGGGSTPRWGWLMLAGQVGLHELVKLASWFQRLRT